MELLWTLPKDHQTQRQNRWKLELRQGWILLELAPQYGEMCRYSRCLLGLENCTAGMTNLQNPKVYSALCPWLPATHYFGSFLHRQQGRKCLCRTCGWRWRGPFSFTAWYVGCHHRDEHPSQEWPLFVSSTFPGCSSHQWQYCCKCKSHWWCFWLLNDALEAWLRRTRFTTSPTEGCRCLQAGTPSRSEPPPPTSRWSRYPEP